HPVDVGHQDRRLYQSIVAQDVNGPFAVTGGEVEQHLEDELRDEGTVLAPRETNDPRVAVLGQVFIANIGLSGTEPVKCAFGDRIRLNHAVPVASGSGNYAFSGLY